MGSTRLRSAYSPAPARPVCTRSRSQGARGVELEELESAVVQGLGPVGMFALMYLKAIGVKRVFAVTSGKNEERDKIAYRLGAERVFALSRQSADEIDDILRAETGGLGVDLAFEASGAPAAVAQGIDMLRCRGVYLVPGQYSMSGGVSIQPQAITFKALHIIGSSQYSICDVRAYLEFLVQHPELHEVIRGMATSYPVSDVNRAFDDAGAGRNIKTVLVKG